MVRPTTCREQPPFVHMPTGDSQKILAYRPGMWDLAGILQLGAKEEANGRVSYVRLLLDQVATQNSVESEGGQGTVGHFAIVLGSCTLLIWLLLFLPTLRFSTHPLRTIYENP